MDAHTPGMEPLWPVHADPEYVAARVELAETERDLRRRIDEIAAARRAMPRGPNLAEYQFAEGPVDLGLDEPARPVSLRDLFNGSDYLFVYHMMFHPDDEEACPMCSMWVDGLHGVAHHIRQHTGFAVIAKAPLSKLRGLARRRGWDSLRLVSSHGTSFNADMRAERPSGEQRGMVSVFAAEGDQVRHIYSLSQNFHDDTDGGIDVLSPVWHVLDLLPTGRGDWEPTSD
jgi:predicted dithiol-disulfide oxidoreductase (DUF899 family)